MALVLTVAQQKGGTGKTTLVANLAAALAAGRRVAILDIDPQRSLSRWHGLRAARERPAAAITCVDLSGWRLTAELDRLRRDHDAILIDSPPHVDTDARLAVRAARFVLVPIQPSVPDLWAAEGTLRLAEAEKRPMAVVLNRVPSASRLRDAIAAELTARGIVRLQCSLGNRAGFAAAFAQGLGVTEVAPRSAAAVELRALLDEILEMTR